MVNKLLVEALVVGISTVVVGSLVGYGVSFLVKSDLPRVCKDWNKFYVMEISLFLTGVLVHILAEYTGINRWYCSNGVACL